MEPDNLERAVASLEALGYRPRAPVPLDQFVDPAARRRWADEKQMQVFSLYSEAHQATEIDLFLEPPIDFEAAHRQAVFREVAPGVDAPFCSLDDLITLKLLAGRDRDRADIETLRTLRGGGSD